MDASHEESKRWSSLESREPELNQAIVDVSREDFLVGNFDLKSLFSLSVGGFYSDDCVLWLGTEEMIGKTAAFQRVASVLEPIYTCSKWVWLSSNHFAQPRIHKTAWGISLPTGRRFSEGRR